jgi:single-strand DNA-binding protein
MAFTAQLTGNLGRDPELKYLDSGKTVANFTVAVRQNKKDAPARWVKVAVWGKAAEYVGNYVRKGDSVLLMGRVEAPEVFTRRDGTTGIAEVFTAENIEKFGERQQQDQAAPAPVQAAQPVYQQQAPAQPVHQQAPAHQPVYQQQAPAPIASDDIPF